MELKDKILEFLARPDYVPLRPAELSQIVASGSDNEFQKTLQSLIEDGEIVEIRDGKRICLPRDADLVVGRIHFRQSGTAIIFPEDGSDVISVPAEETGVAFHGDTVVARLIPQQNVRRFRLGPRGRAVRDEKERAARVIKILKRARTLLTGTLAREKQYFHVIPDDPRIVRNILVPDPATSGINPTPKINDKVVVELDEWKQKHLNPEGRITAVLGRSHEPKTEHAALFVQYGLAADFPEAVEMEAQRVGVPVSDEKCVGRLDLREMSVFTIDPDDAKDFDDALHLERLENGGARIGIHIADVSSYVLPKSNLDVEAERRGNSTYLVGEVVPMLPHTLSSGVCSLKEDEDRLTKSVLVTFTGNGEIEKVEFANTVIRSIKRLTYKQAKLFLDEDDFDKIRAVPPPPSHQTGFSGEPLKNLSNVKMRLLQSHIRQMWTIARRLRQKRMKNGSLDLDMPESKIYIDPQGYPDRIERITHDESHQLVEEFMLLANQEVARAFNRQHIAAIHRVHDKPEAAKLDELRETLATLGVRVGDLNQSREVSKFLELTRTHPKGVYLKSLFLRSLKQACYRSSPDGHFGLAMTDYTHFTSPIRRYADLIVHRIFDSYLYRNALPTAPREVPTFYNVGQLQAIAEHISITEQNSTEAERQSVKNRQLEYFEIESKRDPRNLFEALITEVKNHGFFVELSQSMAFGFIHVSTLQSDFYIMSDDGQSLVGRKTQRKFGVGDRIFVTVEKVDRFKRQIDFAVARKDGQTMPPIPAQKSQKESQDKKSFSSQKDSRSTDQKPGGFGQKFGSKPEKKKTWLPFKKGRNR